MTGYHVHLIRNGQTEANEKGIYIGQTDYPLSRKGAAELAGKLDEFVYPRVPRVYTSPLRRCTETAEILFPDVPCIAADDFIEMYLGDFEGKTVDELTKRDDFLAWIRSNDMEICPPNGESTADVYLRLYQGIDRLLRTMIQEDIKECALITHAGIIGMMLTGFGVPKIPAKDLKCAPGEGYEIFLSTDMWQRSKAFEILGQIPLLMPQ